MATAQHRHREDGDELIYVPAPGDERRFRHDDHGCDHGERHADGVFERLGHLGDFHEEVGELDFLAGCAPRHVDAEHVAEQRLRDVERHAAEEDDEHEAPGEVFNHWKGIQLVEP
jgi:hypothetical protein